MIDPAVVATSRGPVARARRIIRSLFPPIDLFEDIADPEDWPLLIAAEQKTNPRLMETLGALDLVPPARRVGGPGAAYLMAPFTHVSPDRPSRFGDGSLRRALCGRPLRDGAARDDAPPRPLHGADPGSAGWTSQFRELALDSTRRCMICAAAIPRSRRRSTPTTTSSPRRSAPPCAPPDPTASSIRACAIPAGSAPGFLSRPRGDPVQGRHLDYHWDGTRVDLYRDAGSGEVFRVGWIDDTTH